MDKTKLLTFEMPVSETVRYSLRIEHLLKKLTTYVQKAQVFDLQNSISAILDLLTLLNKPELRSKYFQAYSRVEYSLSRIKNQSRVCPAKLDDTLSLLKKQLNKLSHSNGKFSEALRDNPFLKNISQFHHLPGADCGFNTPDYVLWLNQPTQHCVAFLEECMSEFNDIHDIITTHLLLTRNSGEFQPHQAKSGFFQQTSDSRCQLIRLQIEAQNKLFPKISVGQHGTSIQFFEAQDFNINVKKSNNDISFNLAYCSLN